MPESPMEELAKLAASASPAEGSLLVPPVPTVNLPTTLAHRMPELVAWYEAFHKAMEQWRQQTNYVLRGGNQ